VSKPFQIICKCSKVQIGPWIGCCSIWLKFQKMSKPFLNSQRLELDDINPFIYYTMSRRARILFQLVQPQIRWYSTWLTFETMSKYFLNLKKSELNIYTHFMCQIMSGSPWILFQSVHPQIGCYSTWLTFQTMSKPFQIILKSSNVQIGGNKLLYMPNDVWIELNIISIGTTPNQMLFNLTEIRNNVWTIPNIF